MLHFDRFVKAFLFVQMLLVLPAVADCGFRPGLPELVITSVTDGDTLRTASGERLRLVGINTAELGYDGAPDEPLAREARQAVRDFVAKAKTIYWRAVPGGRDRYGRVLGEVYNSEGQSLSASLLRRGLGFYIAVAPVPQWSGCLQRAETQARDADLGVWREPFWRAKPATGLSAADTGFVRINGKVNRITVTGDISWIELDGPVVLRLPEPLSISQRASWQGRELEVAGWLVDRSNSRAAKSGFKPLFMPIGDSTSLRFVP